MPRSSSASILLFSSLFAVASLARAAHAPKPYSKVPLAQCTAAEPELNALLARRDYSAAFELLQPLAVPGGCPAHQERLALLYRNGWGVEPSARTARKLWTLAADGGDTTALYSAARALAAGQGGAVDRAGIDYLVCAANLGHRDARRELGNAYITGGFEKVPMRGDVLKGFHYRLLAALDGDWAAHSALGDMATSAPGKLRGWLRSSQSLLSSYAPDEANAIALQYRLHKMVVSVLASQGSELLASGPLLADRDSPAGMLQFARRVAGAAELTITRSERWTQSHPNAPALAPQELAKLARPADIVLLSDGATLHWSIVYGVHGDFVDLADGWPEQFFLTQPNQTGKLAKLADWGCGRSLVRLPRALFADTAMLLVSAHVRDSRPWEDVAELFVHDLRSQLQADFASIYRQPTAQAD
jgi:TPR repeat protein